MGFLVVLLGVVGIFCNASLLVGLHVMNKSGEVKMDKVSWVVVIIGAVGLTTGYYTVLSGLGTAVG